MEFRAQLLYPITFLGSKGNWNEVRGKLPKKLSYCTPSFAVERSRHSIQYHIAYVIKRGRTTPETILVPFGNVPGLFSSRELMQACQYIKRPASRPNNGLNPRGHREQYPPGLLKKGPTRHIAQQYHSTNPRWEDGASEQSRHKHPPPIPLIYG